MSLGLTKPNHIGACDPFSICFTKAKVWDLHLPQELLDRQKPAHLAVDGFTKAQRLVCQTRNVECQVNNLKRYEQFLGLILCMDVLKYSKHSSTGVS